MKNIKIHPPRIFTFLFFALIPTVRLTLLKKHTKESYLKKSFTAKGGKQKKV